MKLFQAFPLLALVAIASCNRDNDITIDNDPSSDGSTPSVTFSVIEYLPAPGQYINEPASGFYHVSTMDEACRYAEERLVKNLYVSLGSWGGYIIVKTHSPLANTGGFDFAIGGNSFDSSNEPGIVWVMQDSNGNGLPDDQWFELKGSYYDKPGFEKDYSVTYFRPSQPDSDVKWTDSNGESGVVKWQGSFHKQPFYYPLWIKEDSYTLTGSRLPARSEQDPLTGQWTNLPYEWGYADNAGEDSETLTLNGQKMQLNYFRISDAVTASGEAANLPAVDFIKVQTAVNGTSGILGENSTEVCGFFLDIQ